jgi:hypothetical protein
VLIRYIWDAASEVLGFAACTKGAGDDGVLEWRRKHRRFFLRLLEAKPEKLKYNPDLTAVCAVVYDRMVHNLSTHIHELPEEMTVEFEAWALLVMMVTWSSPEAQCSEGSCGGRNYLEMIDSVKSQRLLIIEDAASNTE